MNGLLLWADIQRKVTPENIWKTQALKKFTDDEITQAKETLWRISGESVIGKISKRQGPNKTQAELNDICSALKLLSDKNNVPLFLGTSDIVAQTPIYLIPSPENDSLETVSSRLKAIEEIINAAIDKNNKSNTIETRLQMIEESLNTFIGENYVTTDTRLKKIEELLNNFTAANDCTDGINAQLKRMEESINSLIPSSNTKHSAWPASTTNLNKKIIKGDNKAVGTTTSPSNRLANNSITASRPGESILSLGTNSENRWKVVEPRKSWRQKANILRGTAKCETADNMLSADVHLVVYGLGKQITDLQLSQFIQNKGIQVLGCDLLTKYAEANSLTYKITIRACDYEKATKENIWPIGVGVRLFKFFNNRPEKKEINNTGLQR